MAEGRQIRLVDVASQRIASDVQVDLPENLVCQIGGLDAVLRIGLNRDRICLQRDHRENPEREDHNADKGLKEEGTLLNRKTNCGFHQQLRGSPVAALGSHSRV